MTRFLALWLVACGAGTLLAGCALTKVRQTYVRAADAATEDLVVYKEMGTALALHGTYLSAGFRQTMAAERARLVGPADPDPEAWLARNLADAADFHEVIFSAEAGIPNVKVTFGESEATWRLRLVADGTDEALVTVFKVRKPTGLHHMLYPHFTEWTDLWVARFDRGVAAPAEVTLHVGSGWGNRSITWTGDQLR